MKHQFRSERSREKKSMIDEMLSELIQACQLIEADILAEEHRTRIYDQSDARYPILARTLNERYRNLKETIASLEKLLIERSRRELAA